MKLILIFFMILIGFPTWSIDIPTGLKKSDLSNVIQLLGLNTSSKALTNPFPLGGYSGLEVALSYEIVNTTDLSRLGDTSMETRDKFQYPKISVGKGLFSDIDVFFNFIPFNDKDAITEYGALLRWGFYRAKLLPICFSLIGHSNLINFNDEFIHQNFGLEVVTGINVNDFSLYFGGGRIEGDGKFISSILDLSDSEIKLDSNNTFSQKVIQPHTFVGLSMHFHNIFIAGQIDRYERPVYSAKLGLRF